MKQIKSTIHIVWLIFILLGCASPANEIPLGATETAKNASNASPTSTITLPSKRPTQTATPDPGIFIYNDFYVYSTPVRPIDTAPPLPTPKPANSIRQCLPLILDLKQLPQKEYGAIVINNWFYPKWVFSNFEPYIFQTPEHKITLNPSFSPFLNGRFAVSPDQTKFAILNADPDAGKNDFLVFDRNGKVITSLDFPENLQGASMLAWLEQGILLKVKYNYNSSGFTTIYVLYNPFTKKPSNLQTSFPNHYPYSDNQRNLNEIYYDPSLTQAIYLAVDKGATNKLYYVLWDLSNNREITRLYMSYYPAGSVWRNPAEGEYPFGAIWQGAVWSKNNEFAVVNIWLGEQDGLVRINRDGRIETLVQGEVYEYSISPDSNRLAYWLDSKDSDDKTLYVKDLETGEIQNYCLGTTFPIGTVWSPDSKNLAISFKYQGTVITAIVDLDEKKAVRIEDVSIPVGWLK